MASNTQGQSQQRQAPNGQARTQQGQRQGPTNLPAVAPARDITMSGFLLHPEEIRNLFENAKIYVDSGLIPVKNVSAAALIMLKARTLQMQPDDAFQHVHVINGRTCLSAELMFQRARSISKVKFELLESTDKICRIKGTRPDGEAHTQSYTIAQAQQAGYLQKDNWKRMPTEMLAARCKSGLVRWLAPESLAGMPYSAEEVADFDAIPTTGRTLTEAEAAALQAQQAPAAAATTESEAPPIETTSTPVEAAPEAEPTVPAAETAPAVEPEQPAPVVPAQPTVKEIRLKELSAVVDPNRWPEGSVLKYVKLTFNTGSIESMNEGQWRALMNVVKNSNADAALGEFHMMQGTSIT